MLSGLLIILFGLIWFAWFVFCFAFPYADPIIPNFPNLFLMMFVDTALVVLVLLLFSDILQKKIKVCFPKYNEEETLNKVSALMALFPGFNLFVAFLIIIGSALWPSMVAIFNSVGIVQN